MIRVIEIQKAYLDPELNLNSLSQRLSTNPSQVSNCINQHFQKNFNDFVNGFRVAEFQLRLSHKAHQHLTLLGIALDCGFNSKATFNRVHKRMTGQAPSELVRQQGCY